MTVETTNLIGSWVLADWLEVQAGETVRHPFGKGATGRLLYTDGGTMAAFLTHENWANTAAETPATLDKFLSYAGTYTTHGSTVSHVIDNVSVPFMMGATLTREVIEFSPTKLVLKADIPGRDDAVWHLVWARA